MIMWEIRLGPHFRRAAKALMATLFITVVAGCQTKTAGPPALSLEEAKEVTTEFSGSFVPPPRTVNDLLGELDEADLSNDNCSYSNSLTIEKARSMMSGLPEPVPGSAGRVAFAEKLATREFEIGSYLRGVEFMKLAVDAVPDRLNGMRMVMLSRLATLNAYAGDYEAADDAISDAEEIFLRYGKHFKSHVNRMGFYVNEAKAALAQSEGDLEEAEAFYRKSISFNEKVSTARAFYFRRREFTQVALADNLARQGRLLEAENALREVIKIRLANQPRTQIVAKSLARISAILYEQGRYSDAEAMAAATVRLYQALCAVPESLSLALTRDVLGKALVAQERWREALEVYEQARTAMAKDQQSFERLFAGNLNRALTLLRVGRTDEAIVGLKAAHSRSGGRLGEKHYKTAEVLGFLAIAYAAEGKLKEALSAFAEASQILLTRSREADDEDSSFKARDRRLAIILGAYIDLLAKIRGTALENQAGLDAISEGFRLAEVARSRAVGRALSASGARAALANPELAELARREQDTQKQISVLYGTLAHELSRPVRSQSSAWVEDMKESIDRLRGARAALMAEIESRFPDYAELVNPKPPTLDLARSALRPGEALISTYVGEERTFVWAVPHNGDVAFAAVEIGRENLSDAVALLRGALEPNARTLGDIPEFDVVAAYGLYKELLAPVEDGWRDATSLLVVAHGPLGYLPMSVLPTEPVTPAAQSKPLFGNYQDVPWLARSHAVTMLPSVGSLKALRGLSPGRADRHAFAGFGDPWFSREQALAAQTQAVAALAAKGMTTRGLPVSLRAAPKTQNVDSAELALLPRLPDTAEEVRSMAMAMNADLTESVFIGRDANEGRIKSMDLSGISVLAFATHGLVPGDLNGLTQPALALSSPKVAGGDDDGLLTMGEVLGLKLNADWVVLSACNTGSGDGAGAEAISGLGRAFFYAGTRALLVSNWPVETSSARELTTDLFRRQAADPGLSRAEALRQAMNGLIDGPGRTDDKSGKVVFSYAHPLFWAPFSLIGDGGERQPPS